MRNNQEKAEIIKNINLFLKEKFEEQKLKIAIQHDAEVTSIVLDSTSADSHIDYDYQDLYEIPPQEILYVFNVYRNESVSSMGRLVSFFLNEETQVIRELAYYGAAIEFQDDGDIEGITEEHTEFDDEEKFLFTFLENVNFMDYLKENKFDAFFAGEDYKL